VEKVENFNKNQVSALDKCVLQKEFSNVTKLFLCRWKIWSSASGLKDRLCILLCFSCHSHSDIGNVYLLVLCKATDCREHYDYDRKNKIKCPSLSSAGEDIIDINVLKLFWKLDWEMSIMTDQFFRNMIFLSFFLSSVILFKPFLISGIHFLWRFLSKSQLTV
jgi:hypothetical protein